MVIDASAFLVLLLTEPEEDAFRQAIHLDPVRLASAATVFESSLVVLSRLGEQGVEELRALFAALTVEVVPFGPEQVAGAVDAFRRFGKGRHRAGLNFGDCFSYALARSTNEPLLFKGDDFSRTDIGRAA